MEDSSVADNAGGFEAATAPETPAVDPVEAAPDGGVTEGSASMATEAPAEAPSAAVELDSSELLDSMDEPVDDEVVVLEEFGVVTEAIKPPKLVASNGAFETMRDLSLRTTLPVGYAEDSTFEQEDTFGLAVDITLEPEHGELLFPDSLETEFFYRPDPGFIGQDTFRFRPFTYHKPEYQETGTVNKISSDQEWSVTVTVNQLPREIQTRALRLDLAVERKINILFVIDNSGSMAGEQKILASSFDQFIDGFLEQRLNFRIGVLTTDVLTVFREAKKRSPAVFGAGYLQLTADELAHLRALEAKRRSGQPTDGIDYQPFLDNATPDLTARFEELVQVGTTGHPYETAITPIFMSYVQGLSPGAVEHNTASSGEEPFFYQEEAFLSIVIVSDEDEAATRISPVYDEAGAVVEYKVEVGTNYLYRTRDGKEAADRIIRSLLDSLTRFKKGAGFRIDAVVHPKKGRALSRMAELGGGQTVNIRKDFSKPLIAIGESIARQASRTFKLPEFQPDEVFFPESIAVSIDGVPVPEDPLNGWVFNAERQTVELMGQAGEDSFGAVVLINFDVEYQP